MADIELVIKIPEKEFGVDITDKFQDFFNRLKVEIKEHLITNTSLVCGAYELETIDMFLKAFNNGTPLPKGHGRLIDADKTISKICGSSCGCHLEECGHDEPCFSVTRIESAPTIIEADMERSEE